eukprot:1759140-Rhodomonas_salina.1
MLLTSMSSSHKDEQHAPRRNPAASTAVSSMTDSQVVMDAQNVTPGIAQVALDAPNDVPAVPPVSQNATAALMVAIPPLCQNAMAAPMG